MAYEIKRIGRQKVQYNNDNDDHPLIFQLLVDQVKVTPTSATIAIYKPGNTTAVLAATAMTVSGTLLTYTVDTTTVANYPVGDGYRGEIIVTYNSLTYPCQIYFDVAKLVIRDTIGKDQLIDLDDRFRGMEWDGDEDLKGPIRSALDEMQHDIETHTVDGNHLRIAMFADYAALAVPHRFLAAANIMRAKGVPEDAEHYRDLYAKKMRSLYSGYTFDANQDLEEDQEKGISNVIRLIP